MLKNNMFDIVNESSTRIKTGVILLIAAIIIGFIDSFFVMWLLFTGLTIVAISEAMDLYKHDNNDIYIYAAAIWIVALFYPKPEDLIFVTAIVLASILAYTKELDKNLFLPLLYPIASFLFLFSLYISFGMGSLLWLLVVVAGADIGAYFVGGGIATATILGIIFSIDEVSIFTAIIVSAVVAVASVFGDLFESYLKREADVKDSGDILPGHGGILDRTDGYLFGGVIMLVLLRLLA
jgi:phosphatidate cytidylyltransferase